MNRPWLISQLEAFARIADELSKMRNTFGANHRRRTDEILRLEPNARAIMNAALPGLGDYRRTSLTSWSGIRDKAQTAIGILQNQEELKANLTPDAPSLAADGYHRWVWDAARTFWESKHYAQAVEESWKSINAHLQTKVGRTDISDVALVREALSEAPPRQGVRKAHFKGDSASPTWKSRQRGLQELGLACAWGLRNVVAHEHGLVLDEKLALEYLACLSVLARWIDETEVVLAAENS